MKLTHKTAGILAAGLTSLVLLVLLLLSTGVSGETDSISHYQLARYAFKYPEYFLNHWGKPLFTILSSPLSQFGYTGAVVFNLICGLFSAWFAYRISQKLGYRHAWAAIILTVFTPVYLFVMYSALTEILFSLVLMAGIYLFISKRFIFSAILISLLPLARTEGVMYIALFLVALLWMRQYRALPFLLTGLVIFGFLGWPQYGDFFWYFTKMPYSIKSADLYGSGSFWTYFNDADYILNYPVIILLVTGLLFLALRLPKGIRTPREIKFVTLYILILPAFFGFILAQSYLWWKGLGILASHRFMACVLPLGAVVATAGFDWVMERARPIRIAWYLIGIYTLGLVVYKPLTYKVVPTTTGINFAVMKELCGWLEESEYADRKAYYSDPMYPFYRDMDPFNHEVCVRTYSYADRDPAQKLKMGELLIWDPQFAGYEGHLPFKTLLANRNMRLIKVFHPENPFTVIGGEEYRLAVFLRAPRDTGDSAYREFFLNDFESGLSGRNSLRLDAKNVYSPAAEDELRYLPDSIPMAVRSSVSAMIPSGVEKGKLLLVVTVEHANHKNVFYKAVRDSEIPHTPGEWFEMSRTDTIDPAVPPGGRYKVYVWYTGKDAVFIDDLRLEYMPVKKK